MTDLQKLSLAILMLPFILMLLVYALVDPYSLLFCIPLVIATLTMLSTNKKIKIMTSETSNSKGYNIEVASAAGIGEDIQSQRAHENQLRLEREARLAVQEEEWHLKRVNLREDVVDHQQLLAGVNVDKIFISGKISGNELDYTRLFQEAEDYVNGLGFSVINPTKLVHDHDLSWESYMRVDIKALLDCNGIFMLKGWEDSIGSSLEHKIAKELNFKIFYENDVVV